MTGKTVAENLADLPGLKEGRDNIMPLDKPINETGHIRILKGNLAPLGSVAKITGKDGPCMPEMLTPISAATGADLGNEVAFITDGCFSGGSHGFIIGHVVPEVQEGGSIGLIRNGDCYND